MKRMTALSLSLLMILISLCACSQKEDKDINYIITFSSSDENHEWLYDMKNEGVVTVTPSVDPQTDGSFSYMFLLESVGEGETVITFNYVDKTVNKPVESVVYNVSVDSDFKITASVAEEKKPEETEKASVDIRSASDAEKLVEEKLIEEDPSNQGKLVYETTEGKNGKFNVRVFLAEDGTNVMKYKGTYVVSPDGEITEKQEKNIKDKVISAK